MEITKISLRTFDDLPVAENEADAKSNDLPTRFPVGDQWHMAHKGEVTLVEIIADEPRPEAEPLPEVAPEDDGIFRPLNATVYPLGMLQRYLKTWRKAKESGIRFKGPPVSDEQKAEREKTQENFGIRCDKAIIYYEKQIAHRTSLQGRRSALPKKLQRKLGMLPPV